MARSVVDRPQLPHVNLPENINLSDGRLQCLFRHHNTILDGLTVTGWFLEELSGRQLLTSRQKRNVEAIEDQRAKAGLILDQVYRGSNGMYDSFQSALRATNQEDLAKLIQPQENVADLATKSEQDMLVRLQKNKNRLKSEVTNLENLLEIMVVDDLISRDEKETALVRGPAMSMDRVLDLLYTKGLSVMQHFLRILSHQGYTQLAQDIENTSTSIQVTVNSSAELEDTTVIIVRMIKITRQQQKSLIDLPNELKGLFRTPSGKLTKFFASRYKLKVTSGDYTDGQFRLTVKFEKDAPLLELKTDYFNGLLNSQCNEKAKSEKYIRRSENRLLFAFELNISEINRILDMLERLTKAETPRSTRLESDSDEENSDEEEESEEEDSVDVMPVNRIGGVRLEMRRPLACGCEGDGRCVKPTTRASAEGNEQEDLVVFNVLINKVKSHTVKGKTKSYNYSANEIFLEIRSRQPLNYSLLQDNNGYNILHIVVLEGRMELLQVLFNTGIFSDLVDSKVSSSKSNLYNMTAMDIARKFRMTKTQDEIIKYQQLERSLSMMHKMARIGDAEAVKLLIDRHPQMMNTPAKDGSTALYWGVLSGNTRAIELLLSAGADVSSKTYDGETMLGCAVRYSHKELVRMLVDKHGVDPEEPSAEDKTPVTISIENKDFQILRQLIDVGAEIKPYNLPQLVIAGRWDSWTLALSRFPGLDIDFKDPKGKTALIYACENANKEIFQDLLKRKADLRVKDRRYRNVLFATIDSADFEFFTFVMQRLLQVGILRDLLNERDTYVGSERCFLVSGRDKGILGYHYLEVFRVYLDIFRGIIRSGGACDVAKYGEVFKSGWGVPPPEVKKEVDMRYDPAYITLDYTPDLMPLHFSLVREQPKMALALMQAGADVNAEDHFKLRPVHLACMRGYLDVLADLESKKADFKVREKYNMLPEEVAEANRHYSLEFFFTGSKDISDKKLQQFRKNMNKLLDELEDSKLQTERRRGSNVRQTIVSKLRDMSTEINFFLWKLGTSQIREESERPSEDSGYNSNPVQVDSVDEMDTPLDGESGAVNM